MSSNIPSTSSEPSNIQITKENNTKVFGHFIKKLKNTEPLAFTEAVEKLIEYLKDARGYYNEARPYILTLLKTAQVTLKESAGVPPQAKFLLASVSGSPLSDAYVRLVKTVARFRSHFGTDASQLAGLDALIQSIDSTATSNTQNAQTPLQPFLNTSATINANTHPVASTTTVTPVTKQLGHREMRPSISQASPSGPNSSAQPLVVNGWTPPSTMQKPEDTLGLSATSAPNPPPANVSPVRKNGFQPSASAPTVPSVPVAGNPLSTSHTQQPPSVIPPPPLKLKRRAKRIPPRAEILDADDEDAERTLTQVPSHKPTPKPKNKTSPVRSTNGQSLTRAETKTTKSARKPSASAPQGLPRGEPNGEACHTQAPAASGHPVVRSNGTTDSAKANKLPQLPICAGQTPRSTMVPPIAVAGPKPVILPLSQPETLAPSKPDLPSPHPPQSLNPPDSEPTDGSPISIPASTTSPSELPVPVQPTVVNVSEESRKSGPITGLSSPPSAVKPSVPPVSLTHEGRKSLTPAPQSSLPTSPSPSVPLPPPHWSQRLPSAARSSPLKVEESEQPGPLFTRTKSQTPAPRTSLTPRQDSVASARASSEAVSHTGGDTPLPISPGFLEAHLNAPSEEPEPRTYASPEPMPVDADPMDVAREPSIDPHQMESETQTTPIQPSEAQPEILDQATKLITPSVTIPNPSPSVTPSEALSEAQPVEGSSIEAMDTPKAPTTLPEDEIALEDSAEMVHSEDMEVDSDPPQIDICPPIDEETDRIPSPTHSAHDTSPQAEGENDVDMDIGSDEPEVDDHLHVVSDNGRFRESSLESGEIRSCSAERASLLHSPVKAEGVSINGNGHLERTPASPLNGATYPDDLGLSSPSSIRDTPETQIPGPSSQPFDYGEKIRELQESTTLPISGPAFRPGATALAVFQGEQTQADFPTSFSVQGEVLSSLERWKNRYKTTDDVQEALAISIACYSSSVMASITNESSGPEALLKVLNECPRSWPAEGRLTLGFQCHGTNQVLPLSPPLFLSHDQFMDISPFITAGENTIVLNQWNSVAGYTFLVVTHTPTPTQLAELEIRRRANALWTQSLSYTLRRPLPMTAFAF